MRARRLRWRRWPRNLARTTSQGCRCSEGCLPRRSEAIGSHALSADNSCANCGHVSQTAGRPLWMTPTVSRLPRQSDCGVPLPQQPTRSASIRLGQRFVPRHHRPVGSRAGPTTSCRSRSFLTRKSEFHLWVEPYRCGGGTCRRWYQPGTPGRNGDMSATLPAAPEHLLRDLAAAHPARLLGVGDEQQARPPGQPVTFTCVGN